MGRGVVFGEEQNMNGIMRNEREECWCGHIWRMIWKENIRGTIKPLNKSTTESMNTKSNEQVNTAGMAAIP